MHLTLWLPVLECHRMSVLEQMGLEKAYFTGRKEKVLFSGVSLVE